jgi:flagellar biosynthesis protein FlhB
VVAIVVTTVILSFSPITFTERAVHPILLFSTIIIAYGLLESSKKLIKIFLFLSVILLPLSFIASHPPYIVYSHHPFEYATFTHQWELSTCKFASDFVLAGTTLSNLTSIVMQNPSLFRGDVIIRSFIQEVWAFSTQDLKPDFWREVDKNLVDKFLKVYDNGFSSIYFKQ